MEKNAPELPLERLKRNGGKVHLHPALSLSARSRSRARVAREEARKKIQANNIQRYSRDRSTITLSYLYILSAIRNHVFVNYA
jgi:hypothetical protein